MYSELIATKTGIGRHQIENTLNLLDEGATIPFISRYRKERTGGLDEVAISTIKDEYDKLKELTKRKEYIVNAIVKTGKLTDELKERIDKCWDTDILEDIYMPYKTKNKTKAETARLLGLEPLAKAIMRRDRTDLEILATRYVKGEVKDTDTAIAHARNIIAEWISENEKIRNIVRSIYSRTAQISSKVIKGKEEEGNKYKDYFNFSEPLKYCSSHRFLAMSRGENEGFLKLSITNVEEPSIERIESFYKIGSDNNDCEKEIRAAIKDSFKRLIKPSIDSEFIRQSKEKADKEAIDVFASNIRQLLLSPPLGNKRVLAIDPGFRTGCKVVCLDAQGNLLHNDTIYPHPPKEDRSLSAKKIMNMIEVYNLDVIAIGNGTASRETESFITSLRYSRDIKVFIVSEDGASIYSASKIAREEFPNYDVTVRGAVSIGRRLIDPLAELVKIDPKSIGVGQYQYDVDQTELKKALDRVVESCVNLVGVNLNTASKYLLQYVSGLGSQIAENIVNYRKENGDFTNREQLKKVPRLGPKAFEQCAGFLRVKNGDNPLDNSAVHPESYHIVEAISKRLGKNVSQLIGNKEVLQQVDIKEFTTDKIGEYTIKDIITELEKPGLDPRNQVKVFEFDKSIKTISDLKTGMELPGIVTNITNFGCFVDVGIKENGLIHISQLSDSFVSDPTKIVSIHQHVKVRVLDIDMERKRIQMKLIEKL